MNIGTIAEILLNVSCPSEIPKRKLATSAIGIGNHPILSEVYLVDLGFWGFFVWFFKGGILSPVSVYHTLISEVPPLRPTKMDNICRLKDVRPAGGRVVSNCLMLM